MAFLWRCLNGGFDSAILCALRPQAQCRKIFPQQRAQRFHNQVVIVALRQARDGDRPDATRAMQQKREPTAMHGIVGARQVVLLFLRLA